MKKSMAASNAICPQTTYLLGTYKEDGTPNFGLFCWLSYCWDGELGVMVAIGGEKLTKDRIRTAGVFSANLVSESMLPLADYFGMNAGYDPEKMNIDFSWESGKVLPVPILAKSRWSYELEVRKTVQLDDSEVFICAIRNVLADEAMQDEETSLADRIKAAAPVLCMNNVYFSVGNHLGNWGDWQKLRDDARE